MQHLRLAGLAAACLLLFVAPAAAREQARIFFLHNSVGLGLIEQGGMRDHLADHNARNQTRFAFWDHNYPYIGLRDPEGDLVGYPYSSVCGHNTNPDGLHLQWLSTLSHYASARDSILSHDVIAFKSCYRACDFDGARTLPQLATALAQYKAYYLEMRDVFAQHPEQIFVVVTPPPRHRLHEEQSAARAATARRFARWLNGEEFRGSPPLANLRVFDLFDQLAEPDGDSPTANMLRWEYERRHDFGDSHPNAAANALVGPELMQCLIDAATPAVTGVGPVPALAPFVLQAYPNPFNPATTLRFELPRAMVVTLEIVDLQGRRVDVLATGLLPGGRHEVIWPGRDLRGRPAGSGIFLGRLRAGTHEVVLPLTLVK